MTGFENVVVVIREEIWLQPNFSRINNTKILKPSHSSYLPAYEDGTKMEQSVPKRRHIQLRRRGITQIKKHTTFRTRRKLEIKNTTLFHSKPKRKLQYISARINPYPTAFPYGNGMILHFYQQQESSTTKTVHKVINKGLKTYV